MLVNHFKMRSDVLSYNLGGMGCSAGVIAIGLADKLLQVSPCMASLVFSRGASDHQSSMHVVCAEAQLAHGCAALYPTCITCTIWRPA